MEKSEKPKEVRVRPNLTETDWIDIYSACIPKRNCKHCFGRGYDGVNVKTKKVVPCRCIRAQVDKLVDDLIKKRATEPQAYQCNIPLPEQKPDVVGLDEQPHDDAVPLNVIVDPAGDPLKSAQP